METVDSPSINRSTKILGILVVLLLLLIIFFMIWPLTENAPIWMNQYQQSLQYAMAVLSPYIFVGLLGGTIGVAEITSTFQTYPREAFRTQWAWILVGVNAVAAMIALLILRATTPQMDLMLQIIAVGIGFQAIIRTRFVLAKQVGAGGEDEVAVNLGWLYDQFSNLARRQIDLELMNNRRTAVTQLIQYYPTLAELYDIALYTITARETLTPQEEEDKLEELERLIDPKAPEHFAKTSVALTILENGGQAYVNLLLNQAMDADSAPSQPAQPTADKMVRQLVANFDIEELVALTEKLTDDENIRNYVRGAAKADPAINLADQKATIAHFLVQQIGTRSISQALAES